eukprot:gb/GFBE01060580.1/.p1 GENE.gb/GFBE01060580.1/~~gb/GFBE01060580.1/.p1  ORF type:complete len:359 (+),score=59.64 gb/GFBE01060580.1/:1-1077(+)
MSAAGASHPASEAPTCREQIAEFVEQPHSSPAAATFQACVVVLILASSSTVIIKTMPELHGNNPVFLCLEAVVTVVFTVELLLRLYISENVLAFFTNGYNIVDLIAVLPSYFELCFGGSGAASAIMSLRVLRLMWLIRILRLAKVARHSSLLSACASVMSKVLFSSILVIVGALAFLMVVSASLLYLIESDRCEELGVPCEGFTSIPSAFWFSICTLTTVGYGDVIPATAAGKVLAGFLAICAVMTLSLAGALLSFDFADHFRAEKVIEDRRLDLSTTAMTTGSSGAQDMKDLVRDAREFLKAWDKLAVSLDGCAARAHATGLSPVTMMPMLRLIEERGRTVCGEMQGCLKNFVFAHD